MQTCWTLEHSGAPQKPPGIRRQFHCSALSPFIGDRSSTFSGEHFQFFIGSLACYSFQTSPTKKVGRLAGHASGCRVCTASVVSYRVEPNCCAGIQKAREKTTSERFHRMESTLCCYRFEQEKLPSECWKIWLHSVFTPCTDFLECATYSTLKSFLSARFLFSFQAKLLK